MDLFGSEKRINNFHTFFNVFDMHKESQIIHNRSITTTTAQLLGIKQNNINHIHYNPKSIKIQKIPKNNNNYMPSRKGMDHTLDLYFQSNYSQNINTIGIQTHTVNQQIIVCEICAGYHHQNNCKSTYFVCHMCGNKGHRMFECSRAKCFQCLKLGHIAQHCPFKKMNSNGNG
eukprot:135070_1